MAVASIAVDEAIVSSPEDFQSLVYSSRKPCVLKELDIGRASSLWTADYLREKCGERSVRVHVTPETKMDFINRNFVYRSVAATSPPHVSACCSSQDTNLRRVG